jgi:hypothetical protein
MHYILPRGIFLTGDFPDKSLQRKSLCKNFIIINQINSSVQYNPYTSVKTGEDHALSGASK